ncbi:hypothetical protein SAMN05518672_103685 [Chitinophaga sp. CF118]|uniref:hypothetical protein n=1 Tax=Chitinophaga sp. CF118 TaxID=1884367 RepID=UPI0008F41610|nr:hypothetical protein [Chitinophaga sp. CF118]SFD88412.1 hypothetical protein SAMN05518672_103685 [Chitinophaga sp. CF118]
MTKEQINKLLSDGIFPKYTGQPDLIETHISWVLVCDNFVFKIKKPVCYSFLDFATLEKRKYYCEKEIELNKRLTGDMYIDVQPVCEMCGCYSIGNDGGEIIDYAVRMHKLDRNRQMDVLLLNDSVTHSNIKSLAEKIVAFHKNTSIIYEMDVLKIRDEFNDLKKENDFLHGYLCSDSLAIIDHAIVSSDTFIEEHKELFAARLRAGFYRDCHGDLHSGNIFLLPEPLPFDCIEFNDEYRLIDVLNEVAFLCMDLDAFGRQDLSDLFIDYYNQLFPVMKTGEDRRLFMYYKSYRANIRAKINSLRFREANNEAKGKLPLAEVHKYLRLMDSYMKML